MDISTHCPYCRTPVRFTGVESYHKSLHCTHCGEMFDRNDVGKTLAKASKLKGETISSKPKPSRVLRFFSAAWRLHGGNHHSHAQSQASC